MYTGKQAHLRPLQPAFIMAAAGRDSFDDLLAEGALKIEGDQALAREFLSELRIV